MRFQNLTPFLTHLQNASSRLYLIVSPDEYERKKVQEKILSFLPRGGIARFHEESTFSSLLQELASQSLFSSASVILLEGMKEKGEKNLIEALKTFSGYFIASFPSKQGTASLYRFIEKEGVLLDLSEEKKWEKEKRLREHFVEIMQKAGKLLTAEVLEEFFLRVNPELALVEGECEKLLSYIGEKDRITKQDVESIVASSVAHTPWQIAEKIVWEKRPFPEDITNVEPMLHPLFSALRTELRHGFILKNLLLKGASREEISSAFPGMWPKVLEKKREAAASFPLSYFRNGLVLLFEADFLSKDGVNSPELLIDFITRNLHHGRSPSYSPSQSFA